MVLSQSHSVPFYGYGACSNPPPAPPPFMSFQPSPCGPHAMCDPSNSFPIPPACYNDFYPFPTVGINNQMANLALSESPPGGIVYTEQRGIHIRQISRRTSEGEIRRMILEATGPEAGLINLIEAPLDDNRTSCGWASVHFHSADLARRMVDRLNGAEFKGKTLQVRLLKEGEAINGGSCTGTARRSSTSRQHRGSRHHHRKEDSKRSERKDRDRGEKATSTSSASEGSGPSASSKSVPLIVGTSLTAKLASSSSPSSCKAKEKQGRKSTAVIIADGSSGRKSERASKR